VASLLGGLLLAGIHLSAQNPAALEFDVVSIKRNVENPPSAGISTLPDGSFTMRNQPIRSIILTASPVPVREVIGLPAWASTERYDITAKAPAGATRAQSADMLRAMLKDRLKVAGHVEEQERDVFALTMARADGRLGPQLRRSTLNCDQPTPAAPGTSQPTGPPSIAESQNRCGVSISAGQLVSGGVTMDRLVLSLGTAGRQVINRTSLEGYYAVTLRFSRPRGAGASQTPQPDDPPDIFTAVQEQLGLKLVPETLVVPVFVIDRIERPSPD
jgi:uncharacterized protein (TIGR03435 family)